MVRFFFNKWIWGWIFFLDSVVAVSDGHASKEESLGEYVLHHLENSQVWNPMPVWKGWSWDLSSYRWGLSFFGNPIDMSPSVHLLMMGFSVAILVWIAGALRVFRGVTASAAPRGGMARVVEPVVSFLRSEVCIANMGPEYGKKLAPLFCTLFFFILTMNLIGLIPGMDTATANISVTAALAGIVLLIAVGSGIGKYGIIGFFTHLCPSGVPLFLSPFLLVIEFLGLFVRPFALMVRIFANMLAGHIVLGSLLGVLVVLKLSGIPLLSMVLLIYLLELFVAFMQAFIFVMLASIFVGGIVYSSH